MYEKVQAEDLWKPVMNACKGGKGSSFDVATIMKIMYKDDFICVSVKDDKWFNMTKT